MEFEDYLERQIQLSEESWQHIQEQHPEVTIAEIKSALIDPQEVRECPRQNFVELFYQLKVHPAGKTRFRVVVVKITASGNFISTAMTKQVLKTGRTLYKKEEQK